MTCPSLLLIRSYTMPPLVNVMDWKKVSKCPGSAARWCRARISVSTESPMSWLTMWARLQRPGPIRAVNEPSFAKFLLKHYAKIACKHCKVDVKMRHLSAKIINEGWFC